jgi:putative ABC transport system substrate-binding protein
LPVSPDPAATSPAWRRRRSHGKYLELARAAVVGATRIAVIANPTNLTYADHVGANEAAARQLGLRLQMIPVGRGEELAGAFEAMQREPAEVLVFGPDRIYFTNMNDILERARRSAVPVITPFRPAAEMGALISFGLDARDMLRRAAAYADRLLRGANPADIPIEQPTRFELVVYLKTAKALNLRIPEALRLRADDFIE